jgi:aryl sulfotransferase
MGVSPVRYRGVVSDNARWDGFAFRDGDIVISTPPKCGTTWTQTICALLILETTEFYKPLDLISPWLDQTLRPLEEVVADLDVQTHRRFIKSHTPLDGLPWDDRVTYIAVGRDPRDVALSWDNHFLNVDFEAFLALRGKAVGNDDLAELMPEPPSTPQVTEADRFWGWVDVAQTPDNITGLAGTLHHLETFWDVRDKDNVILLHYAGLKADLDGQMRNVASLLGLTIDEAKWPELIKAATFEEMKRRSTEVGPNQTENIWLDRERFFHRGTNGQWHDILDADATKRYEARCDELIPDPAFRAWVHDGGAV